MVIVCPLPEILAPVLSVAVIVIIPEYEYEPGGKPVGSTLTPNVLPLPLSVPDVAERTTHGFRPSVEAVQVIGSAHVPVSLNVTFCTAEGCVPCGTVKDSVPGVGGESTHDDKIVSVTEKDCGMPCTVAPLASLAAMATCVM
jgi:hypothetical protein